MKKLNQHPQELYLQSFQMLLVGYTDIRAGAATHGHMSFWTLQSLSNLDLKIFTSSDPSGAERSIDSRLWGDITLEDSVVPNFATCNLERRYELEVLMGWQCQSGEHAGRVFFVQARTPVHISSGFQRDGHIRKAGATKARDGLTALIGCSKSQLQSLEKERGVRARFSEPPTYDEAILTASGRMLDGSEITSTVE